MQVLKAELSNMQEQSYGVQKIYERYSQLLHFPTVDNFLKNLAQFESEGYLDFINNRSIANLCTEVVSYKQNLLLCIQTLQMLNEEIHQYINIKVDDYSSVNRDKGPMLNIYEVFIDKKSNASDEALFERILQ